MMPVAGFKWTGQGATDIEITDYHQENIMAKQLPPLHPAKFSGKNLSSHMASLRAKLHEPVSFRAPESSVL
jgi:hypothetical protein